MEPINAGTYMQTILAVVVTGAVCYGAFFAANRLGLAQLSAVARVADKKHNESGTNYVTTVINGRSVVQPHATGETWVVVVEVEGESGLAFVDETQFDQIQVGQQVEVRYNRTRLTGQIMILNLQSPNSN